MPLGGQRPTALAAVDAPVPGPLRWLLAVMAGGVFLSGLRDLYAARGLPYGGWPWRAGPETRSESVV